jgi:TonB family protein
MTQKQARRLLIVAFVLSLLVHLVVTLFVRWPYKPSNEEVQIVHVVQLHRMRIAHITTPPPATPTPLPTAAATAAPVSHPARAHSGTGAGTAPSHVTKTAAPSPVPSPPATPGCASGDTPVQIVASPPPPDIAPNARGDATSGITRVRVTIDPAGSVQNATIVATSGNPSLDLVAVTMARGAQYAPATHACKAVASDYVYSVKFVAW